MTGRPLILHFAILKRKMFTSKRKWNMTAIWWWRSGIQKYAARTGIITHLREKPTSSLAWHVWVIAAIKALIEVRISRNKAGSCQWAAEKKGFDASSRPPFRFHSFKPVLRRQQIYFQFPLWCGGGRYDFFMKGECRSARTDTRAFFRRVVLWDGEGAETAKVCLWPPLRLMLPESPPGEEGKRTVEWNVLSLWERSLCLCHDVTVSHSHTDTYLKEGWCQHFFPELITPAVSSEPSGV